MKLQDKYKDFILNKIKVSQAENIVFTLLHDLKNRRGMRQAWEILSEEKQEEVVRHWVELIKEKV